MTRMRWETCAVACLLFGAGTASGQEASKGGRAADATAPTAGTEGALPSDPNAPHQGASVPETEGSRSTDAKSQGTGETASEGATTTRQKAGTYRSTELRTVTLTVKQVDPENHRVTFEATVKPEANLTESGRPIKLDQLKEGDTVKASFDPKTGDVVRVDVAPAGGAPSEK